ncbi:glutamate-rich WD repeat-containing protein 1 [Neodiprion pinetum]|uniref:Glutamate-rich WD repeat-containing protein 1 n=1 Tax=Neodiprion lecontei TaxID=441921 RepID=A0A6J0C9X4_NEOLC|nr:glutamate-rich WD repeat-containing protein 1 [Neodiprion lecontei]XP_046464904.1 glutamate-rich WD repeat-containing protein 1 [Neodiprion pinetum]XP_046464905.1 glutamate-rich WD repeat-containing protein 1 [Neodiprion pinetum]XP_046464906.1 glutamate-rich WD repeat-containing protein 1 [Neodiprion pinetum]XP_046464907.1 glutamate-rich WD repeat-containing protein 1 [Neodiprion pinetum]XP_046464908.1 glutamate-rich WD repeat-containing protein 1 [Neodiprion pinetum]XP_046585856.1 glutama
MDPAEEAMIEVDDREAEDDGDDDDDDEAEDEDMEAEDDNDTEKKSKIYLPGQPLEKGEELVVDHSAYRMLHQAQTGAPCLSFDIIRDDLGISRETYPMSMYMLAGTQAARTHVNNLLVMKMSNLHGTARNNEESDESDSDDDDDEDEARAPVMTVASIKHQGCVNRVRCTQVRNKVFAASWSELGRVSLWDLNEQLRAVDDPLLLSNYRKRNDQGNDGAKPIFTFKGHLQEGYGLDWCPTEEGTLASGDCKGNIHIWHHNNSSSGEDWLVDQRPYNSHAPHSVEDLQWSPNERHVLASCSVDKSIKIWDTRASPQAACMLTAGEAHTADVNVISWNRKESRFLVSGGDDGILHIWDLRQFSPNGTKPVATFKQHTAPITSVEWHPGEATVLASAGADDQIAQWDLSVEADNIAEQDSQLASLPPQLLFVHQGQTDVKELHWHPQCPGTLVSTAHSGFNVFRTISV